MKIFLLSLIAIAVAAFANFSVARSPQFKNVDEAIKALSSFQPSDLKGEAERLKTGKPLKIDEMYAALENANLLAKTETVSEEFAFQMERVALITFIHNPMAEGAEKILPAYMKFTAVFTTAAESLDPYDEKVILATLEGQKQSRLQGDREPEHP